jgi:hypothetical protein
LNAYVHVVTNDGSRRPLNDSERRLVANFVAAEMAVRAPGATIAVAGLMPHDPRAN